MGATLTKTALQKELQALLVEVLHLDISPDEIEVTQPLFGNQGLGLDSIDVLEFSLETSKKYQVEINSEIVQRENIFENISCLADYILSHQDQKH